MRECTCRAGGTILWKCVKHVVPNIMPLVIISAAGGINAANARAYAQTGVDFLVTTWPYFGKPADVKMQILAEDS